MAQKPLKRENGGPTETEGVQTARSRLRAAVVKALSTMLFYLGVLPLINRFVNRFRLDRSNGSLAIGAIRRRRVGSVQILLYHRVNDERDPFFPGTPIGAFAKQMGYLAASHRVLALEEAVQRMKRNDVPDNAVVITFDDGYKDNYLNAFPILKRMELPATIFVATDTVGSGRPLWHDLVFRAFRKTRVPWLEGVGEGSARYSLRTVEKKLVAQRHVLRFLRALCEAERDAWIERLTEKLQVADAGDTADLMLTWDELAIMQRDGISVGSHTATHPVLSRVSTERAREEIVGSKETLEAKLGVPVTTFAYPNGAKGDYDDTAKQILREAGYTCAVTTTFGTNEQDQDLFELRRGTPWEVDLPAFAFRLNWYRLCADS